MPPGPDDALGGMQTSSPYHHGRPHGPHFRPSKAILFLQMLSSWRKRKAARPWRDRPRNVLISKGIAQPNSENRFRNRTPFGMRRSEIQGFSDASSASRRKRDRSATGFLAFGETIAPAQALRGKIHPFHIFLPQSPKRRFLIDTNRYDFAPLFSIRDDLVEGRWRIAHQARLRSFSAISSSTSARSTWLSMSIERSSGISNRRLSG